MSGILRIIPRVSTFVTQQGTIAVKETKLPLDFQEMLRLGVASNRLLSSYEADEAKRDFSLIERRAEGNPIFVSQDALSQYHRNTLFLSQIRSRSYSSVYHEQRRCYSNQLGNPSSGNTSSRDTHNTIRNSPGAQQTDNRRWHDNRKFYIGGGSILLLTGLFFGTYWYCEDETEGELCSTFREKIGIKKK